MLLAGEGASSSSKSIPYNRRVLLKGLLRTIAISSYAPGSTVRPQVASTRPQLTLLLASHILTRHSWRPSISPNMT